MQVELLNRRRWTARVELANNHSIRPFVVAVTDRAHGRDEPGVLGALGEGPGAELHPVVRVDPVPMLPAGVMPRLSMAMPRALVTSAAVGEASTDQPTSRREQVSSATA
jgi:hypothetical protein